MVVEMVVAAVFSGLGGLLVPRLVASLPEPEPDPTPREDEPPKPPYADLAARPGLALWCAAAAALVAALVALAVDDDWWLWVLVAVVPVGVALAYVDAHTRLLPGRIVEPTTLAVLLAAAVGAAVTGDLDALVRTVVAALVGGAFYWILWFIHAAGMGYGDVRLAALLGGLLGHLGWGEFVVGMYAAFLVFGLPGLVLAVLRRDRSLLKRAFPFGPAMLVGAVLGILLGPWVWDQLTGPV